MALIGVLSPTLVFALTILGRHSLFVEAPAAPLRVVREVTLVLLTYDFTYYWLHRILHHRSLLRFIHGYHHRAKNPTALESFYQHPIEAVAGIGLLFLVTYALGPVTTVSFALVFFLYSVLNVLVHSGFDTRSRLFYPIDLITRRHHAHHSSDPEKNYASITPIPDWLFRTAV
ncbi:MAG: sterol desaturase family protein [Polyangiaceae bacterium]